MQQNIDYEINTEQYFRLMTKSSPRPEQGGQYMTFFCIGDEVKKYLIKWFKINTMDLENLTKTNRYLKVI